jgi:hypothetical protein
MRRLAGMIVFAVCVAPAHAGGKSEQPARVPFEMLKSGHMAVQVKVNGKGPYRLVFDTGAPVTLVNNRLAKEAGVIPKDFRKPLFAPFGSMGQFNAKEFEVGGVKTAKVPVVVMDHPTVDLMSKFVGRLDGIVGMSFFGRFRMTIDYQAKEMTLVPVDFEPPNIMDKMMAAMLEPRGKANEQVLSAAAVLGIRVERKAGDDEAGVTITEVLSGGAADRAGLKKGDRLLSLNDHWTDSVIDCFTAARHLRPGGSTRATVLRDGKELQVELKVKAGI